MRDSTGFANLCCPRCKNATRSRRWMCSHQIAWYQCDIQAVMLPQHVSARRRTITYAKHLQASNKRRKTDGRHTSTGSVENRRDNTNHGRTATDSCKHNARLQATDDDELREANTAGPTDRETDFEDTHGTAENQDTRSRDASNCGPKGSPAPDGCRVASKLGSTGTPTGVVDRAGTEHDQRHTDCDKGGDTSTKQDSNLNSELIANIDTS